MSCNTDYVCCHTVSVFGRYFALTYTADSGRKKQMRFSEWRQSQWRRTSLTCTDMFRRLTVETESFRYFWPCMPVSRVVSCRHIHALYSFLYIRRKWLILSNSMKLILCRIYHNVYRTILNYRKIFLCLLQQHWE